MLFRSRYREGDGDEYASGRAHQNEDRLSLVLFVTDGEPTVGERDPAAIAAHAARLRGSQRVFTFGLGADVNAQLIEQLALEGHGTAQFVRPEEDVERAVGLVASRLTSPIASDLRVSVQCRGDGGCVQLAHALPDGPVDLFAGQAPNAPAERFEAAREATAQRDTKSVGAMDKALTLNQIVVTGQGIASSNEKLGLADEKDRVDAAKRGGDHLFAHRNDRWTDVGFKEGTRVVKIKPFSPAYFAVLDAIPDLRAAFAVGDKVLVAGKHVAIEVSVAGVDTLDGAELRSLKEQW